VLPASRHGRMTERQHERAVQGDGLLMIEQCGVVLGAAQELLALQERPERRQGARAERRAAHGADGACSPQDAQYRDGEGIRQAVHASHFVAQLDFIVRAVRSVEHRGQQANGVRPDPSSWPYTTVRAPVLRPSACATGPAPRHPTASPPAWATRCAGPAPSRLRERTSTSPSRQRESDGSRTSNGATATRLISSWSRLRDRSAIQAPAASATRAPAAMPRRFQGNAGRRPNRTELVPPVGVANPSSAGTSSAAVCGRSAGFFSRHHITNSAMPRGSCGRCFVMGSIGAVTWAASI
jgi:hypothetical protein